MADLKTPLCELLGITHPIVQAPVSAVPEVIAGVSYAGGLGVLQATWLGREGKHERLAAIPNQMNRPFAANDGSPGWARANTPILTMCWPQACR